MQVPGNDQKSFQPSHSFVQATVGLGTFVHIRKSQLLLNMFDKTLKVGSWDHHSRMPTVKITFVQATYVLATFVHISIISFVADLILTNLFDPIFGGLNFCGPNFCWTKNLFYRPFLDQFLFDPTLFAPKNLSRKKNLN